MRWDPSSKRWFGPVELSYKKEGFIVSILIAAPLVGFGVILGMCLVFIRTPDKQPREHGRDGAASRDLWDLTAAFLGLLKGFAMVTFIQVIFKSFVGRVRSYCRHHVN
ncbi:hypothetical protein ABVK25_009524 [Lepraria finkii]|uniref:Uncharacterized protein n=1 Tax=Lepraria finkii TaxID=1340010 RepID=A0ABR4AYE7_9LECA